MAISVTGDFGFIGLVVVATFLLNMYMSVNVVKARKKYKVPYPNMYANESENKQAKEFNCVQRGHQNSLEFLPFYLCSLILGGLKHPILAAGLGVGYLVARFFYFRGYATGVPENRGFSHFLFLFALMGCTISFSISSLYSR